MSTQPTIRSVGADEVAELLDGLVDVLVDCVEGGASVSFTAPMPMSRAIGFWKGVAEEIARGDRILLIAQSADGRIMGTVQLVIGQPQNQPHRADVSKLLVHRDFRRKGIGGKLMGEVQIVATELGRRVLVLDTETGSDAERLYLRQGWTRVGVIPDYAVKPHGGLAATTYFYKQL